MGSRPRSPVQAIAQYANGRAANEGSVSACQPPRKGVMQSPAAYEYQGDLVAAVKQGVGKITYPDGALLMMVKSSMADREWHRQR